jgi:DNA sulfur modification protein DndC
LYQGENLKEEASAIGEVDKSKIPVTGNSRFGCWVCTMVKEDKSLKAFIDKGETWLIPLREFRNWLLELRTTPSAREYKRRNGTMYRKPDGSLGQGPFTMAARQEILRRLLKLEVDTGLSLITVEELKCIDSMWDAEGDLTRRKLVDIYYEVKGTRLPWDSYKTPLFPEDVIEEIKAECEEYDVPFELISMLLIEIEANKGYTRSDIISKAFNSVMNQGWLHFDAIEKGMIDEN